MSLYTYFILTHCVFCNEQFSSKRTARALKAYSGGMYRPGMRSAENKSLNVFNSIAFLSKIWNTSQFAYSLEGSDLCGQENTAVYGPCIATSCQDVQLQLLISETSPAYPGLPFSLIVLKMDAYNQTISSDSMTLLQVQVAHSRTRQQDVTIQVLGSSTFKLQGGSADISISVVPRFASVIPSLGVALLFQNVYIWVSGIDSETLNPKSLKCSNRSGE